MPRMTHWNSPDPIDVSSAKAAVYAAHGWVSVDGSQKKVQPDEPAPVEKSAASKPAAKKAASKRAAKKSD